MKPWSVHPGPQKDFVSAVQDEAEFQQIQKKSQLFADLEVNKVLECSLAVCRFTRMKDRS